MNKSDISTLHQMPWFQMSQLEDFQEGLRFRLVFEAPGSVFVGRELVSMPWFPVGGFVVRSSEEDRLHSEQTEKLCFFDRWPSRLPHFERALSEVKER